MISIAAAPTILRAHREQVTLSVLLYVSSFIYVIPFELGREGPPILNPTSISTTEHAIEIVSLYVTNGDSIQPSQYI